MRSVYDNILAKTAVRPTTITGTGTPTAAAVIVIDTYGYNTGMFDVATGSPTGTAISYVVALQVQECATAAGVFTDATGLTATITGTTTSLTLNAQIRVDGLGTTRLRYLKITPLVTMTPNSGTVIPITATCLLGRGYKGAAANSAAVTF